MSLIIMGYKFGRIRNYFERENSGNGNEVQHLAVGTQNHGNGFLVGLGF